MSNLLPPLRRVIIQRNWSVCVFIRVAEGDECEQLINDGGTRWEVLHEIIRINSMYGQTRDYRGVSEYFVWN